MYICGFIYTHIWQNHIHTQSLVLMQVGYEKNVGEIIVYFCLCLEHIVNCYVSGTYFVVLSNIKTTLEEIKMIDFTEKLEIWGPRYLWLEPYLCTVKFAFLCQHPDCLYVNMVAGIPNKNVSGKKMFLQSFSFIQVSCINSLLENTERYHLVP